MVTPMVFLNNSLALWAGLYISSFRPFIEVGISGFLTGPPFVPRFVAFEACDFLAFGAD